MPLSSIDILYECTEFLIVNKPPYLLSVPGRAEDNKDCLITRLQDNGYPEALIVHRLDWETSGLLVIARDPISHRELSRQFQDREVQKAYIALCWKNPNLASGSIDLPMRYDPETKPRHIIDYQHGRQALTFWKVLEHYEGYSRLELTPITGRSHQLRVHLKEIGHPILGDKLYAHPEALINQERLCLHATRLSIKHPKSNERLFFESVVPF